MANDTIKQMTFDLDTKEIAKNLGNAPKGYRILKKHFIENGFEHRQGSVYVSSSKMSKVQVVDFVEEMLSKVPWLESCCKKMDVTDVSKKQFNLLSMTTQNLYVKNNVVSSSKNIIKPTVENSKEKEKNLIMINKINNSINIDSIGKIGIFVKVGDKNIFNSKTGEKNELTAAKKLLTEFKDYQSNSTYVQNNGVERDFSLSSNMVQVNTVQARQELTRDFEFLKLPPAKDKENKINVQTQKKSSVQER